MRQNRWMLAISVADQAHIAFSAQLQEYEQTYQTGQVTKIHSASWHQ
jgi:hypothetical protein